MRPVSPIARAAATAALAALAALLLMPAVPAERAVSWSDLIAPLRVGEPVVRGYVLSPPRRGEAHDVVYVARREAGAHGAAARVELHVVDRGFWPGILETRSFGVAWEVPPPGASLVAPLDDAQAVTRALRDAIDANDSGFPSVDSIPLASEPPAPRIARVLDNFAGARGFVIGAAAVTALLLLGSLRGGAAMVGAVLLVLGLALRLPELGLPFSHDQDVQRMFTGSLPLREIATGIGLEDRHPPLYFFVLHLAQAWLGQSEAAGRAPAALAGALLGPVLLLAVALMRRPIGATAILAALAVTVSPELLARSREVSEIALYALMLLAAAASLVAALRAPAVANLALLAISHALALFTYYLAPFVVAAHAGALALWRADRRTAAAFAAGIVAGSPALLLAAVTLLRDWGARDVARAFPTLAWGEHSPAPLLWHMARIAGDAAGLPFAVLALAAIAVGAARVMPSVLVPALGVAATFAGVALLSPIARVQAYYVTTVLPLAALALAAVAEPDARPLRGAWIGALALALIAGLVPRLGAARVLYLPDADAFMPRFAGIVAAQPDATPVTVAHYDRTILAYYLARARNRPISWRTVDDPDFEPIESLAFVHALGEGSQAEAVRALERILAHGPALVIERDAFLLPAINERLTACQLIERAPTARLVRCEAQGGGAPFDAGRQRD